METWESVYGNMGNGYGNMEIAMWRHGEWVYVNMRNDCMECVYRNMGISVWKHGEWVYGSMGNRCIETWKLVYECMCMNRYLNDLSYLEIREGTSLQWQCPIFDGPSPSPRESHSAVTIGNRLLVYGGMNGRRLGDVWMLDVGGRGSILTLFLSL